MQSVNLVPTGCQEYSTRRRRIHSWALVSAVALVIVASTTLHLGLARRAVGRVRGQLASARAAQTSVDQQLVEAQLLRETLASRARAIAALPRSSDLHLQLAALAEYAPDGIVFTAINGRRAAARRAPSETDETNSAGADRLMLLSVEMTGYAIDHDDLAALTRVIQQIPHWDDVSLRRAAREPYLAGEAIAFQLDCGSRGEAP